MGDKDTALQRAQEDHARPAATPSTARCRSPWSSAKGRRLKWPRQLPPEAPRRRGSPRIYRRYELPWSPSEEMERRFRVILRNLVIAFAIIARDHAVSAAARAGGQHRVAARAGGAAGDGAAAAAPAAAAAETGEAAREGAGRPRSPCRRRWIRASRHPRADCSPAWTTWRRCATVDLDKFAKNQPKTTDPGDVSEVTRSLITSKAGGTSGGISAPTQQRARHPARAR